MATRGRRFSGLSIPCVVFFVFSATRETEDIWDNFPRTPGCPRRLTFTLAATVSSLLSEKRLDSTYGDKPSAVSLLYSVAWSRAPSCRRTAAIFGGRPAGDFGNKSESPRGEGEL